VQGDVRSCAEERAVRAVGVDLDGAGYVDDPIAVDLAGLTDMLVQRDERRSDRKVLEVGGRAHRHDHALGDAEDAAEEGRSLLLDADLDVPGVVPED
jgi:hypothetical protein